LAHESRRPLVDKLEARHAATDDAFLPTDVIGANVRLVDNLDGILRHLAGDTAQKGIDFVLGEYLIRHAVSSRQIMAEQYTVSHD
jgi:hypothetical protein